MVQIKISAFVILIFLSTNYEKHFLFFIIYFTNLPECNDIVKIGFHLQRTKSNKGKN